MQDDGPGDQLGEEGDKQRVFVKGILLCLAPVGIHQIGDLLEGKKADAERQQDMFQFKGLMKQRVHILQKKIKIFKIEDNADIDKEPCGQNGFFCRLFLRQAFHQLRNQEVPYNAAADDQQIGDVKISVKPEGGAGQKDVCRPVPACVI